MPASSFRLSPTFHWTAQSITPEVPAPAPLRKKRKARPNARDVEQARVAVLLSGDHRPRKRARGTIPQGIRTLLLDRLEVAITDGRIDLLADDGDTPAIEITTGELSLLFAVLLCEEWPALVPTPAATATAPGSQHRIATYRDRVAKGETLHHAYDACPVRGDSDGRLAAAGKLALAIVQRGNGSGPRVIGWA